MDVDISKKKGSFRLLPADQEMILVPSSSPPPLIGGERGNDLVTVEDYHHQHTNNTIPLLFSQNHHHYKNLNRSSMLTVIFIIIFILIFLLIGGFTFLLVDLNLLKQDISQGYTTTTTSSSYDTYYNNNDKSFLGELKPNLKQQQQQDKKSEEYMYYPSFFSHKNNNTINYQKNHWDFTTSKAIGKFIRYPSETEGSVPNLKVKNIIDYSVCCHSLSGHFVCCGGGGRFVQGYGLDCNVYSNPENGEQYISLMIESSELAKRPCIFSFTNYIKIK